MATKDSQAEIANKKRDAIATRLTISAEPICFDEALAQLNLYLDRNNKKRTTERTLILRKLHQLSSPTDIQTLQELLEADNNRVSRATLYNAIRLFCDAQLVSKIELIEGGMAFYVRTVGMPPLVYVICKRCGNIISAAQPELTESIQRACPKGFRVMQYAFNVFGLCHRCQNTLNRAGLRKRAKAAQKANAAGGKTITKNKNFSK